jgi:ornithine cyclodeaminase
MDVLILNESELRQCVALDHEAIEAVEGGFTALAEGKAHIPPIVHVEVQDFNGEVDIKTAYIEGLEYFAIKVASGFLDNHKLGLPTGSGLMMLIKAQTGVPHALLLDNGYLTDVRTAAAGAIAAKHLAPEDTQVAAVIGSGMQARYQARALKLVRDYAQLIVYGTNDAGVDEYVDEMKQALGVQVRRATSAEAAVRECDVLITTTPSKQPIVLSDWLHPGLHITSMGSDSEHKQELEARCLLVADLLVCDLKSQCFRFGELQHALQEGILNEDAEITELGDLTSGKKAGRSNPREITICDLTGVGVQDTAIALLAYNKAVEKDLGLHVGS